MNKWQTIADEFGKLNAVSLLWSERDGSRGLWRVPDFGAPGHGQRFRALSARAGILIGGDPDNCPHEQWYAHLADNFPEFVTETRPTVVMTEHFEKTEDNPDGGSRDFVSRALQITDAGSVSRLAAAAIGSQPPQPAPSDAKPGSPGTVDRPAAVETRAGPTPEEITVVDRNRRLDFIAHKLSKAPRETFEKLRDMKPHNKKQLPGDGDDAVRKRLRRITEAISKFNKECRLHLDINGDSVMLIDRTELGQN